MVLRRQPVRRFVPAGRARMARATCRTRPARGLAVIPRHDYSRWAGGHFTDCRLPIFDALS